RVGLFAATQNAFQQAKNRVFRREKYFISQKITIFKKTIQRYAIKPITGCSEFTHHQHYLLHRLTTVRARYAPVWCVLSRFALFQNLATDYVYVYALYGSLFSHILQYVCPCHVWLDHRTSLWIEAFFELLYYLCIGCIGLAIWRSSHRSATDHGNDTGELIFEF